MLVTYAHTRTQVEGGVCEGVVSELEARGHLVVRGPNSGGYQAIMAVEDPQGNGWVYWGGSEMRKDGQAAGV